MCQSVFLKKIKIPPQVMVSYQSNCLQISTGISQRQLMIQPAIHLSSDQHSLQLTLSKNQLKYKKYFFLYVSLIQNYFRGLTQPYKIHLFLKGIGFKISKRDQKLIFKLGYSHDIERKIPKNILVRIVDQNKLIIYGSQWDHLTQFASQLKQLKKIEPYKGKGILLKNETILRKEGKKSKK